MESIMKFYLKILPLVFVFVTAGWILNYFSDGKITPAILEVYFSVFGTIYAIVIGFVLYVVISNYNEIKQQINIEVNSLHDLRDYLRYIDYDKKSVHNIQERIKTYAESIINKEWKQLINGCQIDTDTSQELYAIIDAVNKIKLDGKDVNDKMAIKMLIKTIGNVTAYRTNRLNSVTEKIPIVLVHLLFFLSLCIVLPFALLPFIGLTWFICNFFAAFTIVYLLNIIIDLNNHFKGYWSISDKPFRLFLEKVEDSLKIF